MIRRKRQEMRMRVVKEGGMKERGGIEQRIKGEKRKSRRGAAGVKENR